MLQPGRELRLAGERWRAAWACDPGASRGRLIAEAASPTRSDFQRDRDRIVHSSAFRRLAHKTQVFVHHEGDHFRTRLTHTIEVSQIARALARSLGLDEDLAETLALAHDLGHTPFGHTGEDALADCMAPWGGFDHNAQALRIVTRLERRYAAFDGLNLTWETLEGLVKHNGPLFDTAGKPVGRYAARPVPATFLEFDAAFPMELHRYASMEAQVAAIADDIAYNAHDIDDALRAGFFAIEDLREIPFLAELLADVDARAPGIAPSRRIHELGRRIITHFVEDVLAETGRRLAESGVRSQADLRDGGRAMAGFSPAIMAADRGIKDFLFARLYRHPDVVAIRRNADSILRDLFRRFLEQPDLMPEEWRAGIEVLDEAKRARRVADYIAGMTDRYAVRAHRRLFDATPELA
jgi:dGTPase